MTKDVERMKTFDDSAYLQAIRSSFVHNLVQRSLNHATSKDDFVKLSEQKQALLESTLDSGSLELVETVDEQLISIIAKAIYAKAVEDCKAYTESLRFIEEYDSINDVLDKDSMPLYVDA